MQPAGKKMLTALTGITLTFLPLALAGCNTHPAPDDTAFDAVLRECPGLSLRTSHVIAQQSPSQQQVALGNLQVRLPAGLHLTKRPGTNAAGDLRYLEVGDGKATYRLAYVPRPLHELYPNFATSMLDNPAPRHYIDDIDRFSRKFPTDLAFLHTVYSFVPADAGRVPAWTARQVKGMLMTRPCQSSAAVELTCPAATFIYEKPGEKHPSIFAYTFDAKGRFRGYVTFSMTPRIYLPTLNNTFQQLVTAITFVHPTNE